MELKVKLIDELVKINTINPQDREKFIFTNRIEYPILSQLLIGIRLLYPTSVECESTFSFMNIIKSASRNQLGDETLDDLLRIKYSRSEDINRVIRQIVDEVKHRV